MVARICIASKERQDKNARCGRDQVRGDWYPEAAQWMRETTKISSAQEDASTGASSREKAKRHVSVSTVAQGPTSHTRSNSGNGGVRRVPSRG